VAWLANHQLGISLRLDTWPQGLWTLVLAPVLEETVFRPLLQRGVHETLRPHARHAGHLANLATACAFAASHLPAQGERAVLWLIPALALGEVWRRSNHLSLCILVHMWFNSCLVWASR
jgi:membrane protease YdiL (CAAX protease family)